MVKEVRRPRARKGFQIDYGRSQTDSPSSFRNQVGSRGQSGHRKTDGGAGESRTPDTQFRKIGDGVELL
jgi:hypothetical protein